MYVLLFLSCRIQWPTVSHFSYKILKNFIQFLYHSVIICPKPTRDWAFTPCANKRTRLQHSEHAAQNVVSINTHVKHSGNVFNMNEKGVTESADRKWRIKERVKKLQRLKDLCRHYGRINQIVASCWRVIICLCIISHCTQST